MEGNGNTIKDVGKRITRVLFCGPHFPASNEYTAEYLQKHSCIKVDVLPLEDVPKAIGNYHVCIVKSMRLDSDIISRAVQMQLIMQYGVGLDGVDIDAATKHRIKVARIPSDGTGNSASCAEMAIYLMLGLLRKQNELQISIQQKKLGDPITDTLFGKTIFILGYENNLHNLRIVTLENNIPKTPLPNYKKTKLHCYKLSFDSSTNPKT
ncbi:hypothetical protein TanjilG_19243 [Lupinus angustifolius]|uniref:D-isomer specific 2-hydroxyacid dehydrogenase catalytic domain-containing protein n=2 Tax=Lupinus angustifolius TaxID=3871 RepID=A0A1J7FNS1_LUPAN|nr:hypothetical protein TanjilG_19243 [Lupinus angustifolius]